MKTLRTPELAKDISRVKVDFALQLNNLMLEKNINQVELAEKSSKSKSLISRILNGDNNLTIETMVEIYHALDEVLIISTRKLILKDAFLASSKHIHSHNRSKSKIACNNFSHDTKNVQVMKNSTFWDSLKKIQQNSMNSQSK